MPLSRSSGVSAEVTMDFPEAGRPVIHTANAGYVSGFTVAIDLGGIELVQAQDRSHKAK